MSFRNTRTALRWLAFVGAVAGCLASGLPLRAAAQQPSSGAARQWVETWAASPQFATDPLNGTPPPSLSGQTIREIVRISAGGEGLRIRLTNEFSTTPLEIGAVHVAIAGPNGAILAGTDRALAFAGKPSVTIPPGAPAISDRLEAGVAPLTSLAVTIYVAHADSPATPHTLGRQTAYISPVGNYAGAVTIPHATTTTARYYLSGVDVTEPRTASDVATIVTLGDSITDGYNSTVDADHRWPDVLAVRLQRFGSLRHLGVANEGISGNRLLTDYIGPNALARFDRDVLSRPGARFVVVLIGINDLGLPGAFGNGVVPTSEEMITGYRQLISRAHERGLRIYGCTLTPFKGLALPGYFTPKGEMLREAINAWIRSSGAFDAVLDFDAVLRDPASPERLLPIYDSGDHLHPSDRGYRAMAQSVPLGLFE